MTTINVEDITPNPDNPRKTFRGIEALAEDIEKNGLLNKILVRPIDSGKFEIVHGERRFRALRLLRRNKIDCEVRELSKEEAQRIALSENIQREDLTPIELANELKRRLETITQQELCKEIGKSQTFVSQNLSLLQLPKTAQEYLDVGLINKDHAKELLRAQRMLRMMKEKEEIIDLLLSGDILDIAGYKTAQEVGEILDMNIYLHLRYQSTEKGEKFDWEGRKMTKKKPSILTQLNGEDLRELIIWRFKKIREWCNHEWTEERYDSEKDDYVSCKPYCEHCGMVKQ